MLRYRFLTLMTAGFGIAGGLNASERNSFYIEGALVHHIKPKAITQDFPVILVPGMNLSTYIYLTTPDGREGWAQQFADAGYEVFAINDPKFDFSRGFGVPGFEEVPKEGAPAANPSAKQGWGQDIWRRWGFGTSAGNPYPESQFPSGDFDKFAANYPYLSRSVSTFSGAISALLKKAGPSVLIGHSAAGPQVLAAAKARPGSVAGLVLVEPTGSPTASDFPRLAGISMLGVYADYVASRRQTGRKAGTEAAADLFEKNGGVGEVISLPDDHGIRGNSHLMMQGKNNTVISGLIIGWLKENAKTPPPGVGGEGDPDEDSVAGGGREGRGRRGGAMAGRVFGQLDADKDGKLSPAEFGAGRRFQRVDCEAVKAAFEGMDKDGDGFVAEGEFEFVGGGGGRRGGGAGKAGRGA